MARSTFPSQNVKKDRMVGPLLKLQMWFCVAGAGILHFAKSEKNVRVFVAFLQAMAGVGHLKRIWKDAFRVARAVQETCSSGILGGLGADFLRGVAFWSLRSSGLLRWFCVTCAALRMTWQHFFSWQAQHFYTDGVEKLQNTLVRGRQLCTQLSINMIEGSFAELLRF